MITSKETSSTVLFSTTTQHGKAISGEVRAFNPNKRIAQLLTKQSVLEIIMFVSGKMTLNAFTERTIQLFFSWMNIIIG